MGFLDNVTSVVNRGTASVQRTGRTTQLKMQLNELIKQRRDLAAQLGASLYDVVKDIPEMREGREPIFEGIEGIDKQRADIEAEIAQLEADAAAQLDAATTYKCPKCGYSVGSADLFCSGCGLPIAEVRAASTASAPVADAAPTGPACLACGAPLNEDDAFCMMCGAKVEKAPAPEPQPEPQPTFESEPAAPLFVVEADAVDIAAPIEPASSPVAASQQSVGGFCTHCGNRVNPGDAFCGMCGSPTA